MQCIYFRPEDKKCYVFYMAEANLPSSYQTEIKPTEIKPTEIKPTTPKTAKPAEATNQNPSLPSNPPLPNANLPNPYIIEIYEPTQEDKKYFCLNREFPNCPRIKATIDYRKTIAPTKDK